MKKLYYYLFLLLVMVTGTACDDKETDDGTLPEAALTVTPESLTFDESDASKNRITVVSNVIWETSLSDRSLRIDKRNGFEGERVITVTDMPRNKTCTLTVFTQKRHENDTQVSRTVTITRGDGLPPFTPETLYADNLDKAEWSGTGFPFLDAWDGYINATGSGVTAGGFSYTGRTVSVRSNFASSGYPGASGRNAFYFGGADAYVTTGEIALGGTSSPLVLTFGCCKSSGSDFDTASDLKVYLSGDGSAMTPLAYTRSTSSGWSQATAVFDFEEVPQKLRIRFVADEYNVRLDDISLATTDRTPTQTVVFAPAKDYPLAELPSKVEKADYKYITHYAQTVTTGQRVRNYTACYDTRRHNPVWVAYPYHPCYKEGGYGRTDPDPWRPDPEMTESEQSVIYASDWNAWPWSSGGGAAADRYQYWSYSSNVGRGHLLASSHRGGANSELNIQTFYPTNIAPESYLYYDHWSTVEQLMPDYWNCTDTIYTVVGCYYENDDNICYDASSGSTQSAKSKPCVIPTARYKVFLRTRSGSTGKPVQECSADELMAIGFWFPQNLGGQTPGAVPPLKEYIFPVSEIEKKLGGEFTFFPSVPAGVKETCNIADWPQLQGKAD